jgi:hypothetical protein
MCFIRSGGGVTFYFQCNALSFFLYFSPLVIPKKSLCRESGTHKARNLNAIFLIFLNDIFCAWENPHDFTYNELYLGGKSRVTTLTA